LDKIKDKGGHVLKNAKVQLIFWGKWNDPSIDPSKEKIETAIQHIIDSDYFSKLSQYRGIQKPAYLGSVVNDKSNLPNNFDDGDIEKAIGESIHNHLVPDYRSFSNGQIIYMVILTPGHYSADPDDKKSDAYHYNFKYKGDHKGVFGIYFGFRNEKRELQSITRAVAHEIAESCTNPIWDDPAFVGPSQKEDDDNEIADYCEKEVGTVNGEIVEGYWSNLDGSCVIPGGSNIKQLQD
jgi:hypothetical protein